VIINSSLYIGSVIHRRPRPRIHCFKYRAFWLLLDLDELGSLSRTLRVFSHNASNLFSFLDADHGDGSNVPLRAQTERLLKDAGVDGPCGRISMLCMPRTLGYCFNPLSVYFCYDPQSALMAAIYQVHNTFGDRHSYVIPVGERGSVVRQGCRKTLYVSPFLDMDLGYDFRVSAPDDHVTVAIVARDSAGPVLNAVLTGSRRPLSDRALLLLALMIPWVTLKVISAIHWEAARLWLKGIRFRRRPDLQAMG
jgi:uncharacterized protein